MSKAVLDTLLSRKPDRVEREGGVERALERVMSEREQLDTAIQRVYNSHDSMATIARLVVSLSVANGIQCRDLEAAIRWWRDDTPQDGEG